ncbi:receptor kinase-like protein Xa21 [Salvia miltiorrhiza]|uniref:receptor kinase-like protein Xa21 n=1 Tax=Salvia miltiorrhiza TaxID=226208 RepID=UPI0025AB7E06|nr:receptor kinase-like protein Xa21 [Salvia miltiorrhiza]
MGKSAKIVMLLGIFSLRICFAASAFINMSTVDELSLLSMKANINSDILARNWSKETSLCTWTGVICGKKHPRRVTAINLANMGLEGTIAKEIGNLSSLRFVDISNNSINGQIPSEIGLLGKLQGLNLSHNYLLEIFRQVYWRSHWNYSSWVWQLVTTSGALFE